MNTLSSSTVMWLGLAASIIAVIGLWATMYWLDEEQDIFDDEDFFNDNDF